MQKNHIFPNFRGGGGTHRVHTPLDLPLIVIADLYSDFWGWGGVGGFHLYFMQELDFLKLGLLAQLKNMKTLYPTNIEVEYL